MSLVKEGHESPVNKAAAMLLAKAPWWAHYPEPAKMAIRKCKVEHSITTLIDYTKPAPDPGAGQQVTDRRGIRVVSALDESEGVITGFSHDSFRERICKNGTKKPKWWVGDNWKPKLLTKRQERIHHWWVLLDDGRFITVAWGSNRWRFNP